MFAYGKSSVNPELIDACTDGGKKTIAKTLVWPADRRRSMSLDSIVVSDTDIWTDGRMSPWSPASPASPTSSIKSMGSVGSWSPASPASPVFSTSFTFPTNPMCTLVRSRSLEDFVHLESGAAICRKVPHQLLESGVIHESSVKNQAEQQEFQVQADPRHPKKRKSTDEITGGVIVKKNKRD